MPDPTTFYADKNVTQPYGFFSDATGDIHHGTDYAPPGLTYGDSIPAVATGTVVAEGYDSGLGNYVAIETKNDKNHTMVLTYGHLDTIPGYSTGTIIQRGATVGKVGSSGITTGPHVHIGATVNGVIQDAGELVRAINTVTNFPNSGRLPFSNFDSGDIGEALGIGSPNLNPVSGVNKAASAVTDAVSTLKPTIAALGDLLKWLTKSQHWWELAFLFTGVVLIGWGTALYFFSPVEVAKAVA